MCLYSIIVFDLSVEYEGLWISVLVCFLFFTIVLFLQHLLHPLHIHQFMFLGYIVVESMCLGYVIFICHLLRSLSVSPFMSLFLSGLSVQSPWFHPSLHLDVWCSHVLITPRFILIAPRLLCTVLSLLPLSCFTPISSHLSNNLVGVYVLSECPSDLCYFFRHALCSLTLLHV